MPAVPPFPAAHPFLFVGLSVVLFYVSWWVGGKASGWNELARYYRAEDDLSPIDAKVWRGRSGRVGSWTRYNNCLTIGASRGGVYIALPSLLRVAHPPLFIPWSDIHTEPIKGSWYDSVRFIFRHASTRLTLHQELATQVLAMRPPSHTMP